MSVFLSLRAETIYRIAFLRFDECWEKSARYTLDVAICKLNYLKCTAGGLYILANESPLSELEVMRTHEYFPNYCLCYSSKNWHPHSNKALMISNLVFPSFEPILIHFPRNVENLHIWLWPKVSSLRHWLWLELYFPVPKLLAMSN